MKRDLGRRHLACACEMGAQGRLQCRCMMFEDFIIGSRRTVEAQQNLARRGQICELEAGGKGVFKCSEALGQG